MKICVDPGHGMSNRQTGIFDPGAVHVENGFQYQEAVLALRYASALKDVLRGMQVQIFMTRDDDSDRACGPPGKNGKGWGCDALISLHLNDFDDDSANGMEVFYGDERNKFLAQLLQDALIRAAGMRDRKIKRRTDLAVLRFDGVAVLVELGFIANDSDLEKILNAQLREAVVNTIGTVITGHLQA